MNTQTVTTQELTAERPEMVESVIDLILADTISILVEEEEDYSHLRSLFIQPQQDIVQLYKQVMEPVDYLFFAVDLMPLVCEVIDNIGADLFSQMLMDEDNYAAHSEVLRCFGDGVSFWDNHDYKDFGFSELPRLKTTLEQPYDIATQILDKIAEAYPELVEDDDSEPYFSWDNDLSNVGGSVVEIQWVEMSNTSTKDNDFNIWLASNYSPAGQDASNGEEWYLSANPNEHLPYSLSSLKQKWESENYNQYICTCSNSDRSYVFEALNKQEAISQMLQKFPTTQGATATLNTGRKITPRKRQLR